MANYTPQEIEEILREFFDVVGKRQYIGARYIPIFGRKNEDTIQWDGGLAPYEPLTIVLHEGSSYTSRTYVPAGIDILDQTYWALTGNYNAQIEAYREETTYVQDSLGTGFTPEDTVKKYVDDTATSLSGSIGDVGDVIPASSFDSTNTVKKYVDDTATSLSGSIGDVGDVIPASSFDSTNTVKKYVDDTATSLSGSIGDVGDVIPASSFDSTNTVKKYVDDIATSLQGNIGTALEVIPASSFDSTNTVKKYVDDGLAGVQARIRGSQYRGKNVLFVTDSWGSESGHNVTKTWCHLWCDAVGANYIDLHQGSTGFYYPETPTGGLKNFAYRLADYVSEHTAAELAAIDFIIACGSCNDYSAASAAAIATGVGNFITQCANFPNCNVIIVPTIAPPNMYVFSQASDSKNPWCFCNAAVCAYPLNNSMPYNVNIIYSSYLWLYNTYLTYTDVMYDNIHPNQTGMNMIARCFSDYMFGEPYRFHMRNADEFRLFGMTSPTDFSTAGGEITPLNKYIALDIVDNVLTLKANGAITASDLSGKYLAFGLRKLVPAILDAWVYGAYSSGVCAGTFVLNGSQSGTAQSGLINARNPLTAGSYLTVADYARCMWACLSGNTISVMFPNDTSLKFDIDMKIYLTYPQRR